MHPEVRQYVARYATSETLTVVEIGSRNINGSIRDLFPNASWHGLDLVDGLAVDEVADGATWQAPEPVDLVITCEALEHAPNWRDIITNSATMLRPGGRLVVTAAGPRRGPHSGIDGGALHDGEYYGNVDPDDLFDALAAAGYTNILVDMHGADVRATATIPTA